MIFNNFFWESIAVTKHSEFGAGCKSNLNLILYGKVILSLTTLCNIEIQTFLNIKRMSKSNIQKLIKYTAQMLES